MDEKLAAFGGKKVRNYKFPINNTINHKEIKIVNKILKKGILSDFLASSNNKFFGGDYVRLMEKNWKNYFKSNHSISVSSWSLGIQTMIGSLELNPGDEIIMSPFTMTSCAASCIFYGIIPVFVDIEKDYFCIDPKLIEKKITKKTKAIMAINIFGQSCDFKELKKICKKYNLFLIEDAAQSIGAKYKNKYLGTMGDIGGFSLNYHKHIQCGEGGIILTNNKKLYQKSCLIRNHGEYCSNIFPDSNLVNSVGSNYRLVEPLAGIAIEQLKKLKNLFKKRYKNSIYLIKKLSKIKNLKFPGIRNETSHGFYLVPFIYEETKDFKFSREYFIKCVKKELPYKDSNTLIIEGYVKPLYFQEIYQKKIGIGSKGFPFNLTKKKSLYKFGSCPISEDMYKNKLVLLNCNHPFMKKKDLDDIIFAFEKVHNYLKK